MPAMTTATQTIQSPPSPKGENRINLRKDSGNEMSGAGLRKEMAMINGAPTKTT